MSARRTSYHLGPIGVLLLLLLSAASACRATVDAPNAPKRRRAIGRLLEDCAGRRRRGRSRGRCRLPRQARQGRVALDPADVDRGRALRMRARLRCDDALARGRIAEALEAVDEVRRAAIGAGDLLTALDWAAYGDTLARRFFDPRGARSRPRRPGVGPAPDRRGAEGR